MFRRILPLVGFTLLLAVAAALGVVADGQAAKLRLKPPLVSVTTDKTSYAPNEMPQLTLTMTNPNPVSIHVSTSPQGIEIVKVLRGRKKLPPFVVRSGHSGTTFRELSPIEPGASIAFPFITAARDPENSTDLWLASAVPSNDREAPVLSRFFRLTEASEYTVHFRYSYTGPDFATPTLARRGRNVAKATFRLLP